MKRLAIAAAFVGLIAAPFLPLYPQRTMTRSQVMGHAGDVISYDWAFGSILAYLEHMHYAQHEDYVVLIFALDLVLALVVAAIIAAVLILIARRVMRAE